MYFDVKKNTKNKYNRKLADFEYSNYVSEEDWIIDEHGDLVLAVDRGVKGIEL